jgi:DNA topoisomerase-3
MKKLIIAEKPSVARNISDAVGAKTKKDGYIESDDYIISWAFGHLLQLFDAGDYNEELRKWNFDTIPFYPTSYKYKVKSENFNRKKIDAGAKKQLHIIETLANREDVSDIISATDDDREGQVIADEIFDYLEIKKPIWRLLLSEWTEAEVKKGLETLKPNNDMKSLHDAGFGRQIADWLIGINITRAATLKYNSYGQIINVGRVLIPTLKIIYDRDMEIKKFESSEYFKLIADFEADGERKYTGTYFVLDESEVEDVSKEPEKEDNKKSEKENKKEDKKERYTEKFEKKEDLINIQNQIKGKQALITDKTVQKKVEKAPYLFNLTNLQGYVTGKYKGWTSGKVLKVAQQLYEKKYTTYPRTASFVLDESIIGKTKNVFDKLAGASPFKEELKFHTSKRVFDSKKVESHSAIIPTYMIPGPGKLSKDEEIVYEAIKNRFLAQFMPDSVSEETVIKTEFKEIHLAGHFTTKGKVLVKEGWKKIEKVKTKTNDLPMLNIDESVLEIKDEIQSIKRKPPKHHTEKTLLKVMETCGKGVSEEPSEEMMMSILSGFSIGTPATRAETIKKLVDVGYVEYQRKNLVCTNLGIQIVETLPVKDLLDLNFTGRLEKTLSDIQRDRYSQDEFLNLIKELVDTCVSDIKVNPNFHNQDFLGDPNHVYGVCPECGGNIVETKKSFGCDNWRNGCKYSIWKDDKFIKGFGKEITPAMIDSLCKYGKVGLRDCTAKSGNKFSAYFAYQKNPETDRYEWKMEFINQGR